MGRAEQVGQLVSKKGGATAQRQWHVAPDLARASGLKSPANGRKPKTKPMINSSPLSSNVSLLRIDFYFGGVAQFGRWHVSNAPHRLKRGFIKEGWFPVNHFNHHNTFLKRIEN